LVSSVLRFLLLGTKKRAVKTARPGKWSLGCG
jgi:hypothetical protein